MIISLCEPPRGPPFLWGKAGGKTALDLTLSAAIYLLSLSLGGLVCQVSVTKTGLV